MTDIIGRRQKWTHLQQQLSNHGYLFREDIVDVVSDRDISAKLITAITSAQENISGLIAVPVRGHFDDIGSYAGIVEALQGRFCGVPDHGGSIGPLTFGSPGGRWTRGVLTVSINTSGCNFVNPSPLSSITPATVLVTAFNQWQAASNFFSFTFVPPGSGEDIRVVFGGTAVDPRFGRIGGVLASASYPEQGNLKFDATEAWTQFTLWNAALHEIGHLLGLSHSNLPGGTMYPYANAALAIDAESQNAIATLYGWQPQQRLDDRGTSDRASLGVVTTTYNFTSRSEIPQMVWKGVGDDSGIYFSEFRDGWTPQQRVGGVGCSHSPSLTEINIPGTLATGLFMAWKGIEGDSGIYWTRNMGAGWEGQRGVAGIGSSTGPALATVNGQIYMAWKGIEGDGGIYWSTYDGVEGWSPQARVAGVGTSDSPALVAYNGMLYMFWKGIEGDSNAYYSFFDFANDPIWKPQRRIAYFSYDSSGGIPYAIGTTGALSAAVRGNRIILTWKGIKGDYSIWYSLLENNEFSGQATVPNVVTSIGPSVVQADGRTYMAWKGIDSSIYWSRL
ncbi:MAG: matrixin family metalloprotease [Methylomicrobium sp.]